MIQKVTEAAIIRGTKTRQVKNNKELIRNANKVKKKKPTIQPNYFERVSRKHKWFNNIRCT